MMPDKPATKDSEGSATAWADLPPHRDHPDAPVSPAPQAHPWDHEDSEEATGATSGEGPITRKAQDATAKLVRLAAEARDAWQQLGEAIGEMRSAAPRDAVLRRRWLDDVGLEAYARAPQISAMTWWAKNRQEAEREGAVGPFSFAPTSIRAAYDKRKSKPTKRDTSEADKIIDALRPEDILGTRFTAEDFLQAEGADLEREVAAMTWKAQRHGEGEIEAAQAALQRVRAMMGLAEKAVEMAHVRAELGNSDPDSDF
ncbi:hypothetical protein AU374_05357 [Cupriavidus metallidurans]|nr:hypothetical protein AU374_05357 [Cupriavidus metallidurans]